MADPEIVRTPDGDPEYLAGALDRAERGTPLRPVDVQELGYHLGHHDARRVARRVEAYARERKRWAGVHDTRPLPFPTDLARLFARLREDRPLGPDDLGREARRRARRALRRLARRTERSVTRTAGGTGGGTGRSRSRTRRDRGKGRGTGRGRRS